ncbi:MAG: 4-alpha-glucanotransferase [Candidatus Omnitrophica bacterium]|nr:4-alpha-glucanotransferase [Candidatus Omnitrophota bacterium]
MSIDSLDKWNRIGRQKRSGVLVPLFCIYSKNSIGIGDFSDLKLLVDWAKETGNSIIQLLPMNEVGSVFCPYDALSAFALEPLYLSFSDIPAAQGAVFSTLIAQLKKKYPAGKPHINYAIKKEKIALLREIFSGEYGRESADFQCFMDSQGYWLDDFALFKALKNFHHDAAWFDWRDEYKYRDRQSIQRFRIEHDQEIAFQKWLQWQTYLQFRATKAYAAKKNILLKGDLPILVSRDSADVWQHAEFFRLEFAAGAPPDMYCAKGQRWGMPTNNWEQIRADGFRYICEKLKYAGNFYDILRIDHAVGLFRIWSIPYDDAPENHGLNGFFDPGDEGCWGAQGRGILETMLSNTGMLLCAEDLGIIPRVCIDTLRDLGIPGNDVQRWVKDWDNRHDFLEPKEYRELSVAMLSTHDTTNWPAWWENEAGTVDEALFMRKCKERSIDYEFVRRQLFDQKLSGHGRLRWKSNVDSVDKLCGVLGKRKEEVNDFVDLYLNTYQEKVKLWKHLGFSGAMREKWDSKITEAALTVSLQSKAIFCINTVFDWLYLTDCFSGDPYQYRINTPGTISKSNWSLTIPVPLERLIKDKVNKKILTLVQSSGRK